MSLIVFRQRGCKVAARFPPKGEWDLVWESEGGCRRRIDCSLRNCLAEHWKELLIPYRHCQQGNIENPGIVYLLHVVPVRPLKVFQCASFKRLGVLG